MKTSNLLLTLSALMLGAGCQSNQNHASSNIHKPEQAANYNVTIESIPTNRLAATSREGDNSGAVYSSNIIAVYVNDPGKTNGGITNAVSISAQGTK